MKTILNTLMLLLAFFKIIYGQEVPPTIITQFEKKYDSGGHDGGRFLAQTPDGGYIITGTTDNLGDRNYDGLLLRMGSDGNTLWAKAFDFDGTNTYADAFEQAVSTADGGFIAVGTGGNGNGYIIKTDGNGNKQWETTTVGALFDIITTADGGYMVVGYRAYSSTLTDMLLVKINASGTISWEKLLNFENIDVAHSVVEAPANSGYFIAGWSYTNGNSKFLMLKVDAAGNIVWEDRTLPGVAHEVTFSPDGDLLFTGMSANFTYFSSNDYRVVKKNISGTTIWDKTYGNANENDVANSLSVLTDGSYLITGNSGKDQASGDVWLVNTNSNGDVLWTKKFGGEGPDSYDNYNPPAGIATSDGRFAFTYSKFSDNRPRGDIYLTKIVAMSSAATSAVSGHTYIDNNSNCTFESGTDYILANRSVKATPIDGSAPFITISDNGGFYQFTLPDGDYNIEQEPLAPYTTTCNAIINVALNNSTLTNQDFWNIAPNNDPKKPLEVEVKIKVPKPYVGICPGVKFQICTKYTNTNTEPFVVDNFLSDWQVTCNGGNTLCTGNWSDFFELQQPAPSVNTCQGGPLTTFDYSNSMRARWVMQNNPPITLQPNTTCEVCLDYIMNTNPFDPFKLEVHSRYSGEGISTSDDDTKDFSCAKDPNDKTLLSPEACGSQGYIRNEELKYKVRFQNTGTAHAHNVVVEDKLDEDLDLSTFHMVGSSHAITRTEILPDRTLRVSFIGIELPDTSEDYFGSNGHFIYTISPKAGLATGTVIKNASAIYFDGNEAVITNTTFNTIRNDAPNVTLQSVSDVLLSDSPVTLNGSPAGGSYSGSGVTGNQFDPKVAGIGTHKVTYSYSESLPEDNYSANQSGSYNPINGTGTSVSLSDNQMSAALPIGFNFNFYGTDYTDFYISSNGFITFNSGSADGCCTGDNIPTYKTNPSNLIAFAWDNLNPAAGGNIAYFTTGAAPNRKLVVNFTNVNRFGFTDNPISTQLVLVEGTNIIEVHTSSAVFRNAMTMGVMNNGGAKAAYLPGRNQGYMKLTNDFVQYLPPTFGSLCAKSATQFITVLPVKATITASGPTEFCQGDTLILTANENGSSYSWSNGATTKSIRPTVSGDYKVTVSFASGDIAVSDSVPVVVKSRPFANAGPDKYVCLNESYIGLEIGATASGGTSVIYAWKDSEGNTYPSTATIVVSPSYTTVYTQKATDGVTGCSSEDEVTVYVSVATEFVTNGGFEEGMAPNWRGQINYANGWTSSTDNADLFDRSYTNCLPDPIPDLNLCGISPADINCIGVPCNHFGQREHRGGAVKGNRYAGLFGLGVLNVNNPQVPQIVDVKMEGMSTLLDEPLAVGTTYNLTFYASLADRGEVSTAIVAGNPIDPIITSTVAPFVVKFSENAPTPKFLSPTNAPVKFTGTATYSGNWQKFSYTFVADEAYKYLIMETAPEYLVNLVNSLGITEAASMQYYIYVDDVSLTAVCPYNNALELTKQKHTVCKGNCLAMNANASILSGAGPYTYKWSSNNYFQSPGTVTSASPTICPAANITYTLTVTDANGIAATTSVIVELISPTSLLSNGGFEEGAMPTRNTELHKATGWYYASGNTDLYDANATCGNAPPCDYSQRACVDIPCNYYGTEYHRTASGHRYSGLWAMSTGLSDATPYVAGMQKLLDVTMEQGKQYVISYYASLAESGDKNKPNYELTYPLANKGYINIALLETNALLPARTFPVDQTPLLYSPTGLPYKYSDLITQKDGWTLVQHVFTADKNYYGLVLESGWPASMETNVGQYYIYIDDVSITSYCPNGQIALQPKEYKVCPSACKAIQGRESILNYSETNSYTYKWSPTTYFNASSNSTSATPTICPSADITYTLEVSDALGNKATTSVVIKAKNNLLDVSIPPLEDIDKCKRGIQIFLGYGPQSVNLLSSVSGGSPIYSYTWSPSSGLSNTTIANPLANPTASTTYSLVVRDSYGCSNSASVKVRVVDVRCNTFTGIAGIWTCDRTIPGRPSELCTPSNTIPTLLNNPNVCLGRCSVSATSNRFKKDTLNAGNVELYPNPTEGTVMVAFTEKGDQKGIIYIYNSLGEKVFETDLMNNTTELNLEKLCTGLYFYNVNVEGANVKTGKLIKID